MSFFQKELNSRIVGCVCTAAFLTLGLTSEASAAGVEFSEAFLKMDGAPVDLKFFEQGSSVLPGVYSVDLYLNGVLIKRQEISFIADASGQVKPDVSLGLLKELGFNAGKAQQDGLIPADAKDDTYLDVAGQIAGAALDFDVTNLALQVSLPQTYVRSYSRGYVDPSVWDQGITAFYSDYQASFNRNTNEGTQSDYHNLNLRNGFNIAGWRFRNESALTGGTGMKDQFLSNRTYVESDVVPMKGKLSLGELYTPGEIFDSVRFRGAQIASDLGMLPDNEIGYAPVIRGIAETNATVEVRQNGYVIYSAQVPPGAFEFTDIYPSGSNGDMRIRITESDGRVREYQQSYAYQPIMTRRGNLRYSMTAGEYRSTDQPSPTFTESTAVYGVTDNITSYGGVLLAQNYRAAKLGAGVNSGIGGISFDVTTSTSERANGKADKGHSVRFLYSKTLNATNTTFTMAGYRYSTEGYRSFSQHVDDLTQWEHAGFSAQKSRINLRVNQTVSQRSSIYLSMDETSYWKQQSRTRNWQFGYGSSVGSVSYNVAVSRIQSDPLGGGADTQLTASISMPLGSQRRSHRLTSYAISSNKGDSSLQSSVSGYLDDQAALSYSAQAGHSKINGNTTGASLDWDTPVAKLRGGYSQGRDDDHIDMSASGSLVAHSGGITLGQPLGETFGLVEVPDTHAVGVAGWTAIKTNSKGYAVVPHMQPYRYNWLSLDTQTLGTDVEINDISKVLVPTRGAIVKASYAAQTGRRSQFVLRPEKDGAIPFGAQGFDEQGKPVGIVDNLSRLLAFGVKDKGALEVRWAEGSCKVNYELPPVNKDLAYERIDAVCRST
ncbi:fimbria/pilus outer membrane usher protein [Pseudomonas chlororaphis]|uniref:fimbria/pilus outer membrane usher protein n=1 Tax=Pseudomonas chlororaphis TaxID=587753 RepID=UPI0023677569|nr:fimbria/pilus outer membrane usher protein [Pseudomonas chlororaphis]WDG45258.1 fimbrial biogenesis outer membrane usher protein [Pseudomonas chlororaphis]